MIHHYFNALYRSWDDEGKANRAEFAFFFLWHIAIAAALYGIDFVTHWKLLIVYLAATFVQTLVLFVRRLHDSGKNGWWFLLIFLPVVGWLWLLYFLIQKSKT